MVKGIDGLMRTPVIQPGTSDRINRPWADFFNQLGGVVSGGGVSSLNALVGALLITGVGGISVLAAGSTIQISAAGIVVPVFAPPEVPVDSGDHQNFTLTQMPNPQTNLPLFLNGLWQFQGIGNDYTVSGNAITLANALSGSFNLVTGPYQY